MYIVAGVAGMVAFGLAFNSSTAFESNILRLGDLPYTVEESTIRNSFELHIENKRAEPVDLTIGASLPDGFSMVTPMAQVHLDQLKGAHVPVFISVPTERFTGDMTFEIVLFDGSTTHLVTGRFLGPNLAAE